jgi:hypothetical protein
MFDLRRHLESKLSSFGWNLRHSTLLLSDNVFVLRAFDGEEDPQHHLQMTSSSWGPSAEKKTPNSSPFVVLDRFFITSSIRKKYEGFWMPKVQKTPFLSLLLKNEYKIHDAYRSTDQPVRTSQLFAFFTWGAI